jgi:hypothetical protein
MDLHNRFTATGKIRYRTVGCLHRFDCSVHDCLRRISISRTRKDMAVEGPKRGEAIELILCACSNSFYTKARGIEYREANNPVTEVWRTWQRSNTDAMSVDWISLVGGFGVRPGISYCVKSVPRSGGREFSNASCDEIEGPHLSFSTHLLLTICQLWPGLA